MKRIAVIAWSAACIIACSTARAPGGPVPAPAPPRVPDIFWPGVLDLDARERSAPPHLVADRQFVAPKVDVITLPNGLRCFLVERRDLPIVFLRVMAKRGTADALPGVGQMMGRMLFAGTPARTAGELGGAFRRLGIDPSWHSSRDALWIDAEILSPWFRETIGIVADVFRNSTFPAKEFELDRASVLEQIARRNDDPGALLTREIDALLYPPEHPYHKPLSGTREDAARVTREQVLSFYGAAIKPDTVSVIVAGRIDRAQVEMELQRVFGPWTGRAEPRSPPPAAPTALPPPSVILVDQPGMMQATLALAKIGISNDVRDLAALSVTNEILGAVGTGRLYENLRGVHGSTYWIRSNFEWGRGARPFTISTSASVDRVAPVIEGILGEVRRLGTELVDPDELARAKSAGRRRLPARFATLGGTVAGISDLVVHDRGLDEYEGLASRIDAVTREEIRRVAVEYLQPEALRLFVIADAEKLRPELEKLALGTIEVKKGPRAVTKAAEMEPAGEGR
jgi:zinc protease